MQLPQEIQSILQTFNSAGHRAYAVGGCVRDLLRGVEPKDWDITTAARPEEIQELFENTTYENEFGTVIVKTESDNPALAVVEVTTFRRETQYSNKRHPDRIAFTDSVEEDLARRDFTMNAIALGAGAKSNVKRQKPKIVSQYELVDPFEGQADLADGIIRTVGNPEERFGEDALRMMRAVRFVAELGFAIESATLAAIEKHADDITHIAWERIGEEFTKLVMGPKQEWVENAMELLHTTGLMHHILPELEEGAGVEQAGHHIYTVWEHNLHSLGYAVRYDYDLAVRLGALLHDVGKPRSKEGKGEDATFYHHEVIGATMTHDTLTRLRYPNSMIKKVRKLVRWHLFYYEVDEVTASSIRRLIRNVGKENIGDLIKVRIAERKGSGVPKARPYRLRHMEYMIEKVLQDPLETSQLAIDGNNVMELLSLEPGPRIGLLLNALLADVIEDPEHNTKKYLTQRVQELHNLPDSDLTAMAKTIEREEKRRDKKLREKYHVK